MLASHRKPHDLGGVRREALLHRRHALGVDELLRPVGSGDRLAIRILRVRRVEGGDRAVETIAVGDHQITDRQPGRNQLRRSRSRTTPPTMMSVGPCSAAASARRGSDLSVPVTTLCASDVPCWTTAAGVAGFIP